MAAKFKYYDGSKWVTPSEVNANPTLAGTETELSGLEIDGVKYKISAGGSSGESIEVDLYFSDFDLSGNVPVVTNQEKAEKLKSVLAKDDKDFIYLFADFPYLVDSENLDNDFGGKMSFYTFYILNLKAFISLSSGSADSQAVLFVEQNNELTATMLKFPKWYTEALFTAMATDATKHISLKFTVVAGSSVSPNPEPVAGGSVDTSSILKNYAETLTLKDNNGDTICSIHRVLALKTTSWYFGALNSEIQSVASQLSLSIPTITDDNTMQTALSTIMTALQTYGYGSQISGMISTFLTEFDFVLKQRVLNQGSESYPLFMTGENSAYIMINGSFSSLFTAFDITDAYTVDYYMQEVNVTD